MKLFYNSFSAISPLGSFDNETIGLKTPNHTMGYFVCAEPDYKKIIDKKYLRRMSKFIKIAVANSVKCLADARLEQPDAIITGTGLGCVTDTIDFLQQINTNAESLLNPTPFMQSTHNSASGQIALLLNCKNVNLTFSQKNISFESALLQAKMMLAGENFQNILVGGMDEITPESYQLISKTDCFRNYANNHPIIPGEGAAFFILTNQKSEKNLALFNGISFFCSNFSEEKFSDFLQQFFNENNLENNDIDLFLTGAHPSDAVYKLFSGMFDQKRIIRFKEYCGEYDTSSAFALWLALSLINKSIDSFKENFPRKVMIHNQGSGFYHSLILVSQC